MDYRHRFCLLGNSSTASRVATQGGSRPFVLRYPSGSRPDRPSFRICCTSFHIFTLISILTFVLYFFILFHFCYYYYYYDNNYNDNNNKMIIYLDFLPPPGRGSHVKSDNAHTIIQHHLLAHILGTCVFSWDVTPRLGEGGRCLILDCSSPFCFFVN